MAGRQASRQGNLRRGSHPDFVGDFEGYIHIIDPLNGSTIGRKKISKKPIKTIISRSNNFYAIDEGFNIFSLSL